MCPQSICLRNARTNCLVALRKESYSTDDRVMCFGGLGTSLTTWELGSFQREKNKDTGLLSAQTLELEGKACNAPCENQKEI